jgi:hypothetical protein
MVRTRNGCSDGIGFEAYKESGKTGLALILVFSTSINHKPSRISSSILIAPAELLFRLPSGCVVGSNLQICLVKVRSMFKDVLGRPCCESRKSRRRQLRSLINAFNLSAFLQTKEVPHVSDGNKVISGFARIIFSSSGIG